MCINQHVMLTVEEIVSLKRQALKSVEHPTQGFAKVRYV